MSKRPNVTTHDYLVKAPLPPATDTYTVIPHGAIINKVREILIDKGFDIERELYRCNELAQVAQGIYHIKHGDDPDLGMMFAWSNSYDKSMRFKCSIGAYVHASLASIIGGNMSTFGRKHTGTADEEAFDTIEEQITNAEAYFAELVAAKELMKTIVAPEKIRAEFMGRLYFINELITGEQLSLVKTEFRKPSYAYTGVKESVWEMYNGIVFSLQKAHPRTWMDQQKMIHYMIMQDFNLNTVPVQPLVDTNQLNIIDEIEKIELVSTEDIKEDLPHFEDVTLNAIDKVITEIDAAKVVSAVIENSSPEVAVEEVPWDNTWMCMKCNEMQKETDVFHDGQLCGKCYEQ
jgi:hypothetical protein